MSTVNESMKMVPFHVRFGRLLWMLPPLISAPKLAVPAEDTAQKMVAKMHDVVTEACNALLEAKIDQSAAANQHRTAEVPYCVGDLVMLATNHQHCNLMPGGHQVAAKFLPRWDRPYKVIEAHADTSNYTLELPGNIGIHPCFHASKFKPYRTNDDELFPGRHLLCPELVITAKGDEELLVYRILDERPRRHGKQYLVCWLGYNARQDSWVPGAVLKDCVTLDAWEKGLGGSTGQ